MLPEELDRPGWMADGACVGIKPAIMVPVTNTKMDEDALYAFPRTVCSVCEVRERCLEYALDRGIELNRNTSGMWGGKTPRERRQIIRTRKTTKDEGRRT